MVDREYVRDITGIMSYRHIELLCLSVRAGWWLVDAIGRSALIGATTRVMGAVALIKLSVVKRRAVCTPWHSVQMNTAWCLP